MYRNPTNLRGQNDSVQKRKNPRNSPRNTASKNGSITRKGNAPKSHDKSYTVNIKDSNTPSEFINNAIHEYFLYRELHNTLDSFKGEIHKSSPERKSVDANMEIQLLEVSNID